MGRALSAYRDDTETDDERMIAAATAVLQRRLGGALHRDAVLSVSAAHALSPPEVVRSWAAKKHDALGELTRGRVIDACPWTDAEVRRLARIFAGKLVPYPDDRPDGPGKHAHRLPEESPRCSRHSSSR